MSKKESKLQKDLVNWLKKQGCIVLVLTPGTTIPTGFPDVLFLYKNTWGVLEAKRHSNSSYRPLQKAQLKRLGEMSYARSIDHENYQEILLELLDNPVEVARWSRPGGGR